jgi:Cdc6-like AAA superfamily ATPase
MTVKLDLNNIFVGPKALFDPNYIPPKLLYRKKEQKSLFSILNDAISDKFSLNILYQGINGIGKKAIANKVINDLSYNNEEDKNIHKISIDCKQKDFEELIFSVLTELLNVCKSQFAYDSLLTSNLSHLWNVFKILCKRIDCHLFFIFTNVEHMKPKLFKKLLYISKETNVTSIYTINKILQPTRINILSEFDLKKKLNYFSYKELHSILKQRITLGISHEVDEEIIKYISDLVCEQYVPVPGKGIEILRDLYPLLKNKKPIMNCDLIALCQNHFDQMQIHDEFSLLNYISDENFLNIIFLDNLTNYFTNKMNYYISLKELEEVYHVSCESLKYKKNYKEFQSLIKELLNTGIIRPSKKTLKGKRIPLLDNLDDVNSYFMVVSPKQLKAIIDTLFNNS